METDYFLILALSFRRSDLDPFVCSVRSNGTDVEFEDCTGLVDKTCPTMDMTTVQKRNCKEDHQVNEKTGPVYSLVSITLFCQMQ